MFHFWRGLFYGRKNIYFIIPLFRDQLEFDKSGQIGLARRDWEAAVIFFPYFPLLRLFLPSFSQLSMEIRRIIIPKIFPSHSFPRFFFFFPEIMSRRQKLNYPLCSFLSCPFLSRNRRPNVKKRWFMSTAKKAARQRVAFGQNLMISLQYFEEKCQPLRAEKTDSEREIKKS